MNNNRTSHVTRRQFLTCASLGAVGLWPAPRDRFAQDGNLVIVSRKQGAVAKIAVQNLCGSVSVLSGPGGNIAILSEDPR